MYYFFRNHLDWDTYVFVSVKKGVQVEIFQIDCHGFVVFVEMTLLNTNFAVIMSTFGVYVVPE